MMMSVSVVTGSYGATGETGQDRPQTEETAQSLRKEDQ